MSLRCCAACVVAILVATGPMAGATDVKVEPLLSNLALPCGVAIRPGGADDRHEIYVADRVDRRVVRCWSDAASEANDIITNLQLDDAEHVAAPIEPLGMLFIDRNRLVIGESSEGLGARLCLFDVASSVPIVGNDFEQEVSLRSGKTDSKNAARHVLAIARLLSNDAVSDGIVATTRGTQRAGGLWRIALRADSLHDASILRPRNDAQSNNDGAESVGVAVGANGYIVIGCFAADSSTGAMLAFVNPINGEVSMTLATNLHAIVGLAYSPTSGLLYAINYSEEDPAMTGVFRIDDASAAGRAACTTVMIAQVDRPTALAFAPDGTLYVTSAGAVGSDRSRSGKLLKIVGKL